MKNKGNCFNHNNTKQWFLIGIPQRHQSYQHRQIDITDKRQILDFAIWHLWCTVIFVAGNIFCRITILLGLNLVVQQVLQHLEFLQLAKTATEETILCRFVFLHPLSAVSSSYVSSYKGDSSEHIAYFRHNSYKSYLQKKTSFGLTKRQYIGELLEICLQNEH